jgi:membrane protease YdiL (CAAX protease family)
MAVGLLLEILLFLVSFEVLEMLAFWLFGFDVADGLKPEHMMMLKSITVPASLVLIVGLLKMRREGLRQTGLSKPSIGWWRAIRLGALSALPLLLVSVSATAIFSQWFGRGNQDLFDLSGQWAIAAFLIVGIVAGGLAEEIQFRGYLFRRFEQLFSGGGTTGQRSRMASMRAAWMTSLVFAGLHFYQGPAVMGAIFLVALGLQFLYLYSGRNLIPGMVCHSLFNGIQIFFLWYASTVTP